MRKLIATRAATMLAEPPGGEENTGTPRHSGSLRGRGHTAVRAAVVGALIAVTCLLMPASAQAYSPGTAKAFKPVYNTRTGNWDYKCSYANWRSGAKVVWECNLWHPTSESEFGGIGGPLAKVGGQQHSGSWTPPPQSMTTSTYHIAKVLGQGLYCTEAYALNDSGGVTNWFCNY